eukprot:CAMPEP_0201563932 /NCGR_PEP_ID=MMETSP0190_2-20130828/1571_1 /ASSEMBLY_ACC=CAM_ASM_000263 /TAXON_ID=37353 /ORGANISM="Rosalina sp." /LENGTH=478 /DNA_ID=CAMNT_0047979385 /DNA_START=44 /DNA_END=1481 /DNA_ORIENTATION=+
MLLLPLVSAVLLLFASCETGNLPNPVIGAYFPNWAQYRAAPATFTPTQAEPIMKTINVLYYGFAYFCPNSSMSQPYWITQLKLCQGKNAFDVVNIEPKDPQYYSEFVGYKSQNPALKVIISIGGWNFPSNFWSQMASDVSSRTAFINSAKAFMSQYGFDGIDIDWEYPKSPARQDEVKITCQQFDETSDAGGMASDGANLVELVKEMRAAFGADKIITIASQADMKKATDEDIKGLFEYIDMYNLMTYDYTVSDIKDSPITAPNQPLYPPPADSGVWNDSTAVTINGYLAQGIPANKMSVGIAYYGHAWYAPGLSGEENWCKYGLKTQIQGKCCGPFAQTYGALYGKYSQLCGTYMYSEIQKAGFTTCFNNDTQSAIGYAETAGSDGYTEAGVWISYIDQPTIKAIVTFAKERGLGGAFAFDLSMDSMTNGAFSFELTKEIAQLENTSIPTLPPTNLTTPAPIPLVIVYLNHQIHHIY